MNAEVDQHACAQGPEHGRVGRLKVTLVVRSLTRGGTQIQLVALARGLARRGHAVQVATFYGGGVLERIVRSDSIPVLDLGKSSRWDIVRPLRRLVLHLRATGCDVVYSMLPMENHASLMAGRWTRTPVVWGLRSAAAGQREYGIASRMLYQSQFRLMRFADAVISNSVAALEELGMLAAPRMFVVPNGIDCERFQPRVDLRRRFRDLHRLDASVPLVGMVARLDKMKDHETFLKAARLVAASDDRVRFVVAGGGPDAYRAELISTAERLGLARRVLWLGDIHDPVDVYSALDVLVSASVWEGFSNTIAEAMACGVAVVATSVGDSTRIVGRLGAVVPPRAPEKVAEAMLGALRSDNSLRERARARILEEYSLDAMVTRTESILRDVSSARMKITE